MNEHHVVRGYRFRPLSADGCAANPEYGSCDPWRWVTTGELVEATGKLVRQLPPQLASPPPGDRIRLIAMPDELNPISTGSNGNVTFVKEHGSEKDARCGLRNERASR